MDGVETEPNRQICDYRSDKCKRSVFLFMKNAPGGSSPSRPTKNRGTKMILRDITKRRKIERKTVRERKLDELENSIEIKLNTKVPDKWLIIDTETGEVWRHTGKKFKLVTQRSLVSEGMVVLRNALRELMG